LNFDALKTLYHSVVYPYLDYCIEVYGSAKSSIIEPLCRMQRKVILSITYSHYRADTAPVFERCKELPLSEIHVFKTALFMYRVYQTIAPISFNDMFFFVILQYIIMILDHEVNFIYQHLGWTL